MLYREKKKLRSYSFRKPRIDLWKNTKNHIYRAIHYGEAVLSNNENFVLFGDFCFKSKNSWHFEFSISQIFRQKFVVSENLTYLSQLLLKLRTVELAISFFPLMQKYIFWKLAPKQEFGESFMFFDLPITKWRFFYFFAKLNGNHILIANFSKFRKYQTFDLIECHNLSKVL